MGYSLYLVSIAEELEHFKRESLNLRPRYHFSDKEIEGAYDWCVTEVVAKYLRTRNLGYVKDHLHYQAGRIIYDELGWSFGQYLTPKLDAVDLRVIIPHSLLKVTVLDAVMIISKRITHA